MSNYINAIRKALEQEYTGENLRILLNRLKELEDNDLFLGALRAAGVDNWSGYGDAQEMYEEWRKENDEIFLNG